MSSPSHRENRRDIASATRAALPFILTITDAYSIAFPQSICGKHPIVVSWRGGPVYSTCLNKSWRVDEDSFPIGTSRRLKITRNHAKIKNRE